MTQSLKLRTKLLAIFQGEIGTKENPPGSNTGARIIEYQRATTLAGTRWKYCAAFICWGIREWGRDPEVLDALKLTPAKFEAWRPKTPAAYGFHQWAEQRGLFVVDETRGVTNAQLRNADIVTFDFSHVGILRYDEGKTLYTIEANTSPGTGGNDGGGVYGRARSRSEAKKFIRILPA